MSDKISQRHANMTPEQRQTRGDNISQGWANRTCGSPATTPDRATAWAVMRETLRCVCGVVCKSSQTLSKHASCCEMFKAI